MGSSAVLTISDEELDDVSGAGCLVYLNGSCLVWDVTHLPFVMSLVS